MKLSNIHGFESIQAFVSWKLKRFAEEGVDFHTIFTLMFDEESNTMVESSDGYRIQKYSYAQGRQLTLCAAQWLKGVLSLPKGSMVGLCMGNSLEWIEAFWSILLCGYNPVLINLGLPKEVISRQIECYHIEAVLTDGQSFPGRMIAFAPPAPAEAVYTLPEKEQWGERVYFMSSGSSGQVKLCGYGAEDFYYQMCNSLHIIRKNPRFAAHYQGELKQLALLPFYHVFGFIAVYLWYGFFSRTFVFPKDLSPQTIQNTIRKHRVTHIFAVPMVFDTVRKTALRTIRSKGDKVYERFTRGLKLSVSSTLGNRLMHKAMGELRSALFGDSIRCLISGGGAISSETLSFFNGIGYWLVNGFGMTETGITGVDCSRSVLIRCLGSVGEPLPYTEYRLNAEGELLIRGKSVADCILIDGQRQQRGEDWYNSHDLAVKKEGLYYIHGRSDDMLISKSGENLNPVLIEKSIHLPGAEGVVLISLGGEPTLLICHPGCYSVEKVHSLLREAGEELKRLNLHKEIRSIKITPDELAAGDFKLNRKKIAKRCIEGSIHCLDGSDTHRQVQGVIGRLEKQVCALVAASLDRKEDSVGLQEDFFSDLGGSSLEYLLLADSIFRHYGVDIKTAGGRSLHNAGEICDFISGGTKEAGL